VKQASKEDALGIQILRAAHRVARDDLRAVGHAEAVLPEDLPGGSRAANGHGIVEARDQR